ncbi:MAG: transpeptidase family protein [Tannerellaceae bacterium]|jgi:cell division protein FtsI (penicillin-binding protein 3)|nr:transpeptidase family protein [Tannerellaceae bacterium]
MGNTKKTEQLDRWILFRYGLIVVALIGLCIAILINMFKIAFVEKSTWQALAERERTKIPDSRINPERGNIYSADGRLMATSFPLYHIYIDFRGDAIDSAAFLQIIVPSKKNKPPTAKDSIKAKINSVDSLAFHLSRKLNRDRQQLREELVRAFRRKDRRFRITDTRITYSDLKEIRNYPFFRLGRNASGMVSETFIERRNPYASLAARTIGNVYATLDTSGYSHGKNGLELQYDSLLRGEAGLKARRRIGGRWMDVPLRKAVRGLDIITTLDLEMQYSVERALRNIMTQTKAYSGSAVVMEVKTGAIKAMANLGQEPSGGYVEKKNYAVSDQIEPGSTFKTASLMVALDDGVCTPDEMVDTGNGIFSYKGRLITDHNRDNGGNSVISLAEAMYRSSNIGVSKVIIRGYEKDPKRFVDGILRLGFGEDLRLEIPGAGHPTIRRPDEKKWTMSDLPSMAYGYVTSIPPIYMLTFYNAIANNGRMMRPIFVREARNDNETVHRFEPEVIKESICTPATLSAIRSMLEGVVEDESGTGRPARSSIVRIAGKTGTALIGENGSYTGNGKQVSFAGYFPAENPEYSCIVVVRRPQVGVASGGGTAGRTVKEIAEAIYTSRAPVDIRKYKSTSPVSTLPPAKPGDMHSLKHVLNKLDVKVQRKDVKSPWVELVSDENGRIMFEDVTISREVVPQVLGMGAKDAVYILESVGLRVKLSGTGRVVSQSIQAGEKIEKGQTITLALKI